MIKSAKKQAPFASLPTGNGPINVVVFIRRAKPTDIHRRIRSNRTHDQLREFVSGELFWEAGSNVIVRE